MRLLATSFALLASTAPLGAQQYVQRITPSAPLGALEALGTTIAFDGTSLFAGAPYADVNVGGDNAGAVYVYTNGPGGWEETVRLTASDAALGERFGTFIAVDGDHAAITPANKNSVYVFENGPLGWTEVTQLSGSDGVSFDGFGRALALENGVLVVGASNHPQLAPGAGKVFVFERLAGGWAETDDFVASDGATAGGSFGRSLALDETNGRLLVGRPSDDENGNASGSVYVFEREPTGWGEVVKLTPSNPEPSDLFGEALALDGDRFVATAPSKDVNATNTGAAWVFRKLGSGEWVQDGSMLRASDRAPFDLFGSDAEFDGGRIVIGARGDDGVFCEGAFCYVGSLYTFHRSPSGWEQTGKLIGPQTFPVTYINDQIGTSIALDGTTLLAGSPGNEGDRGAIFEFDLPDYSTPYGLCAEDGPCGNHDAFGGCENSTGVGALLIASGSGSVSADDLVLSVSDVPPGQFGLLYMGSERESLPFGDGLRLVGPGTTGTFRFDVQSTGAGTLTEGPGIAAFTQSFPVAGQIAAGEIWSFQAWFRDPGGPCGAGFNLSNALEILFRP